MPVEFFVEGRPQTAGSKTAIPARDPGGRPVVVESGDRRAKAAWREDVRAACRRAIGLDDDAAWPLDGPIVATFEFVRRRPKSHYGSGRNAGALKPGQPSHPTTRPDVLKLSRAVEDALTGIAWHDDAAIVDERLLKSWGAVEGVRVRIEPLTLTLAV